MEKSTAKIKKNSKPIVLGRVVMNAIRKFQGNDGISLVNLKKHLKNSKNAEKIHEAEVKMFLKNSLDRGVLVREGGHYKVKENSTRKRGSAKVKKSAGTRKQRLTRSPAKKRSRTKGEKSVATGKEPRKRSPAKKSSRAKGEKSVTTRKEHRKRSPVKKTSRPKGTKSKISDRKKPKDRVDQNSENPPEQKDNAESVLLPAKSPDPRAPAGNVPSFENMYL